MRLVDVYSVREQAVHFLYKLLAERPREANISHAAMPTMQQHRKFVASKPYRAWFLIEEGERYVGAVYATQWNEIGIAVLKECQGFGVGRNAVAALMEKLKPLPTIPAIREGRWLANVAPDNERSHRLFTGLGGKVVSMTYAL